jgi:Family of unknown function (DUF6534)
MAVLTHFCLKGDVVIALLLCYYLRRRGGNRYERYINAPNLLRTGLLLTSMPRTNSIIARLIRYSITTGLATRYVFSCVEM